MKSIHLLLFVWGILFTNISDAEELPEPDIRLTAECEPIATVAGCVNVISGDYFEVNTDIQFNDSEPWGLTRFYDSGHLLDNSFLGFGFGANFPFYANQPKIQCKHYYGLVDEREGCRIPYRSKDGLYSDYTIDKSILKKGYTNLSKPGLKSHVNIANTRGKFDKDEWKIKAGNGSKRSYGRYGKIVDKSTNEVITYLYDLREEILPSGNRINFGIMTLMASIGRPKLG
jgi:hypothetical protein